MFSKTTYQTRRNELCKRVNSGLALFPGNNESPMNYRDNAFHFRQDSTFLYYIGIDDPNLTAVIDLDSGETILFADEFAVEDIIWMGSQKSFKEKAADAGIQTVYPLGALTEYLTEAQKKRRSVHILPPYRQAQVENLRSWLKTEHTQQYISEELIRAVVAQRSLKSAEEVKEIEKAHGATYDMHVSAMRLAKPGLLERQIAGHIEGIALKRGAGVSFPVILSVRGEILHNHLHNNVMQEGDLLVNDSGAESDLHYAADITRTFPVNGRFTLRQKEIYEIVLKAQTEAIAAVKPEIKYKDVHLLAARVITKGLKELGLMKGDMEEAVNAGAHALFFPHGLGHMMGLDVHDMENLGEDFVGYDAEVRRSRQFGLAYLRLARRLQAGFVLTVEPGVYFIPALFAQWKAEQKHKNFIDYDKVEGYLNFGGIRIEDDVLVTEQGQRVLGKPIPKTVVEVEEACRQ